MQELTLKEAKKRWPIFRIEELSSGKLVVRTEAEYDYMLIKSENFHVLDKCCSEFKRLCAGISFSSCCSVEGRVG